MKYLRYIVILLIMVLSPLLKGQSIYVNTFGSPNNPAIIYLHGGPSGSAIYFENILASQLSKEGFFIIVYDRRGEGRSKHLQSEYNYSECFDDIDSIYERYNLNKATLLTQSFGGLLAMEFAQKKPEYVKSIVLTSTPINLYNTGKYILKKSINKLKESKNETASSIVKWAEKLYQDSCRSNYTVLALLIGYKAGILSLGCKEPSTADKVLRDSLSGEVESLDFSSESTKQYVSNEGYPCKDYAPVLKQVVSKGVEVYGIFGENDVYLPQEQVNEISSIVGSNNLETFKDGCHAIMISHKEKYIQTIKRFLIKNK